VVFVPTASVQRDNVLRVCKHGSETHAARCT
jgi:hypothetical protein